VLSYVASWRDPGTPNFFFFFLLLLAKAILYEGHASFCVWPPQDLVLAHPKVCLVESFVKLSFFFFFFFFFWMNAISVFYASRDKVYESPTAHH
jgi:hypothetical protein